MKTRFANRGAALAAGALLFLASLHDERALGASPAASDAGGSQGHNAPSPTAASGDLPIPLDGVEVRANRPAASGWLEFEWGALSGSIEGFSGGLRNGGFDLGNTGAAVLPPEENLLAAAAIAFPMGRRESMFVDGGQITLRDPIDVAALGAGGTQYWTAWGGLQIRF